MIGGILIDKETKLGTIIKISDLIKSKNSEANDSQSKRQTLGFEFTYVIPIWFNYVTPRIPIYSKVSL